MGIFIFTVIGLFVGLIVCGIWISIDQICDCAPLAGRVANGVMGLSVITGFVAGVVASAAWD